MIHTADLIANRREYAHMKLEDRKSIFLALFYFSLKCNIKATAIIVDKTFKNNKIQLRNSINQQINNILVYNHKYFSSFNKIIIYYDNGQEKLGNIIKDVFAKYNYEIIEKFNHQEERLFQVADMFCVINKINHKYQNHLELNNQEKYFFNLFEIEKKIKDLNKKKFP